MNIFSLDNKLALVTGASGHLGSDMAIALAEAGAHVLVNGRSKDSVKKVVNRIQLAGFSAESAVFDVTKQDQINTYFKNRMKDKALHVIVNGAYSGSSGNIECSSIENFRESNEVSVVASHNIFNVALPNLRKSVKQTSDASIINITSMYGLVSPDLRIYKTQEKANPPFYGTSKAALIQWTKYAACEFGHEGIRVNCISPGPFPEKSIQENTPDFITKLVAKVPINRIGQPNELKGPVLFLASQAASYVTGINLLVDGGWTSW